MPCRRGFEVTPPLAQTARKALAVAVVSLKGPEYVKLRLMASACGQRPFSPAVRTSSRQHVEGDRETVFFRGAGERHGAVPQVSREQCQQPRFGLEEVLRLEGRRGRKRRFAELQPAFAAAAFDCSGQMQITRRRQPTPRMVVVDVEPVWTE